jgi:hypothetical protein
MGGRENRISDLMTYWIVDREKKVYSVDDSIWTTSSLIGESVHAAQIIRTPDRRQMPMSAAMGIKYEPRLVCAIIMR